MWLFLGRCIWTALELAPLVCWQHQLKSYLLRTRCNGQDLLLHIRYASYRRRSSLFCFSLTESMSVVKRGFLCFCHPYYGPTKELYFRPVCVYMRVCMHTRMPGRGILLTSLLSSSSSGCLRCFITDHFSGTGTVCVWFHTRLMYVAGFNTTHIVTQV